MKTNDDFTELINQVRQIERLQQKQDEQFQIQDDQLAELQEILGDEKMTKK